ncbi:MAG: SCO family protein [Gemmatimonadetes bacterium]|nr:SCO family protein [Gemmatimonadota bacterium]
MLLAVGVLACGEKIDRELSPGGFIGAEVVSPRPMPNLVLTDAKGAPYNLAEQTRGTVTLLFFGYMHCPDVCPVHLANIAAVLDKLPEEVSRQIKVVFVTVDPARDSMAVLAPWVAGFDPRFIALTGSDSTIKAAQLAAGLLTAEKDTVTASAAGTYLVGHASQVIAHTRDGLGRVQYPFGTRQRDWAHDLPRLVEYGR